MDSRILLVKSITLLYLESHITGATDNSADMVRKAINSIKLPETVMTIDNEKELLIALKETALYMVESPVGVEHDKIDLLQRLQVNCGNDDRLYESFCQVIDTDLTQEQIKKTAISIKNYIRAQFNDAEMIDIVQKMAHQLRFKRDSIDDVGKYIANEIESKLEPHLLKDNKADPNVVASVGLDDLQLFEEIYETVTDSSSSRFVMQTGFQAVDDAMQGGMRKGESWVFPALQHRYKTGFSLSVFAEMCRINTPVLKDPTKKPLMLRISFEDSLVNNFRFLFKYFWMCEYGKNANLKNFTAKQMAAYVQKNLKATGYHVQFMRVNPSGWSYRDIADQIAKYEADGYEVHVLALDYLSMLPIPHGEPNTSKFIQELYKKVRNLCSSKDIIMFTPHQLSSDAKNLIREGVTDFVKQVEGKGMYQMCKAVDNEVDGEMYIHIERKGGSAWLTLLRGKHRGYDEIPEDQKYIVYPFPPTGPIPSDHGKERSNVARVGLMAGQTTDDLEDEFA